MPYHDARIEMTQDGDGFRFHARRRAPRPAEVRIRYRPIGPATDLAEGSLEAFVADRRALVAQRYGRLWRTDVEHAPWRLRPAEAAIESNSLVSALGLRLPDVAPVTHLADDLVAVAHMPRLTPHPDTPDTGPEGE